MPKLNVEIILIKGFNEFLKSIIDYNIIVLFL